MLDKLRTWLSDRCGFEPIRKNVLKRRIPKAPWYFGDGATLMTLFLTLVITGSFMTLTYSAAVDSAYDSVVYLTEIQPLGWFVRALHYWAAGMMMIMLVVHITRQILLGGYKPPREVTWIIGVLILACILVMSFTGYVLRWDERGLYALKVALNMFYKLPLIGDGLVAVIQGGSEVSNQTLTRIYSVHVILLPLTLYGLIGYHLYLVIFQGVTTYSERREKIVTAEEQRRVYKEESSNEKSSEYFHPDTSLKSGTMSLVILMFVFSLAYIIGPQELYPSANLTEESFPMEEWWFYWYSALIALLPGSIVTAFIIMFPITLFTTLLALPFIDRGPNRGLRRRPFAVVSMFIVIASLLFLTDLRRRSPWTGWPTQELIALPERIELSSRTKEGHLLFSKYGCTTCHSISGKGRNVGSDLSALDQIYSIDELQDYIGQPPEGVAMPAYRELMSEDEISLVSEFVLLIQTAYREEQGQ